MKRNKNINIYVTLVSVAIIGAVGYLLSPRDGRLPFSEAGFLQSLPKLNATVNFLVTLCLLGGFFAIKRGNRELHKKFMLSAVGLSVIFLVSYVTYHYNVEETKFGGAGFLKGIYYFILLTHILLAMVSVPLVLFSVYYGLSGQHQKHRKIVRFSFPVWLYVAITGVLVYLFISPWYGA